MKTNRITKAILGLIGCAWVLFGCTIKPYIGKDLVYATLNEIIQQDTLFARVICGKFDRPDIPPEIHHEFFNGENEFVRAQIRNSNNIEIEKGRLHFYWKRKNGLEESIIDTTCSSGFFYRLTYPIFSKDLQTVVVGITEDCNCTLGGWGFKGVYRLENGKWKLVKKFDSWIS